MDSSFLSFLLCTLLIFILFFDWSCISFCVELFLPFLLQMPCHDSWGGLAVWVIVFWSIWDIVTILMCLTAVLVLFDIMLLSRACFCCMPLLEAWPLTTWQLCVLFTEGTFLFLEHGILQNIQCWLPSNWSRTMGGCWCSKVLLWIKRPCTRGSCCGYRWGPRSYASPKYILWILAYVLGAGTIIRKFSPAFGRLMPREQQLEGEYRQLHSHLWSHSESIAFYGGEAREEFHIQQKLKSLVTHMGRVLHDQWWFRMIQGFFLKYLGATVAVVLIMERVEMLSNPRYQTSVITSLFQSLGTLSISSRRLNRLRSKR